ncbi:hypothetical protein JYT31_00515 [Beggiatoa alba]|nr:hypothetical protein [Beggiatoa alba]
MKPYRVHLFAAIPIITIFLLWHNFQADKPASRLHGFNLLQHRTTPLNDPATLESLKELKTLGANAVAFVPFLEQTDPGVTGLALSDAVTEAQLRAGLRFARDAGLTSILKPQILVEGSWSGAIDFSSEAEWDRWFSNYGRWLHHFAQIAEQEQVDILVIGTELKQTARNPRWTKLISELRQHYQGLLSYAAHNMDGLRNFAFWPLLDSAAVTLYPSLGDDGNRGRIRQQLKHLTATLSSIAADIGKPLWIAEIGIASRRNAQRAPWQWRSIPASEQTVDLEIQAVVIDEWLKALQGKWNHGVMIWHWFNAPQAGGSWDNGFTLQGKPAAQVVACHWNRIHSNCNRGSSL